MMLTNVHLELALVYMNLLEAAQITLEVTSVVVMTVSQTQELMVTVKTRMNVIALNTLIATTQLDFSHLHVTLASRI